MLAQFDQTILLAIQATNRPWMDNFSRIVSRLAASPWFWGALVGLGFLVSFRVMKRAFWPLVVALALELVVVESLIKPFVQRSRPFWVLPTVRTIDPVFTSFSFPSGHAAATSAAAWVLGFYFPKLRLLLVVGVILVAASRVYNGDHWPSDVLAGLVIGSFFGWLTLRILAMIASRRENL